MATLLLTQQPGTGYITFMHSRVRERLLVHLRAAALDRAIANGACPDSTALLSLRAHKLIGRATRRRVARQIRRTVRRARRCPDPLHQGIPICRQKVLKARATLDELADRLFSPRPVDARGVAQLQLLLCDGGGPLYCNPHADDLEQVLLEAIDALEVRV